MEQQKDIFTPSTNVCVSQATQNLIEAYKAVSNAEMQVYKAVTQWHSQKSNKVKALFKITEQMSIFMHELIGEHIAEEQGI